MEVKILSEDKNSLDLEVGSLTLVEVLRVYAHKNGAKMAAWKREHPTKNPVLHIEGDNPKKILKDTINSLTKEIDSVVSDFKKLK